MSTTNEQGLRSDRVRSPPGVDLNEFCCLICSNILWKPVACQSCENPFCSACISKRFEMYPGQCPMECDVYTERSCPPFIMRQLAKLQIDCIHQPNGCEQVRSAQQFPCGTFCGHSRSSRTRDSRSTKRTVVISDSNVSAAGDISVKKISLNTKLNVC